MLNCQQTPNITRDQEDPFEDVLRMNRARGETQERYRIMREQEEETERRSRMFYE